MSTLNELAVTLGQLYRDRAALNLTEWQIMRDIQARELALTPADGWLSDKPKSNEDQREAARMHACAADEALQKLNAVLAQVKEDQATNEGQREAYEAERRASEWQIRNRLCDALQARGIQNTGDDNAFDEVAQQASDQMVDAVVEEESDFPF